MEAYRIDTVVQPRNTLVLEHLPFQTGAPVEVIVIYQPPKPLPTRCSPAQWPILQGGQFLGDALRREEIYDDAR